VSEGWANVKLPPFNAAGDGTRDDRTSIQLAIDSIGSSGGGVVYFPTGIYRVTADGSAGNTAALRLRYSNVWLEGDGPVSEIRSTETSDAGYHVVPIVLNNVDGGSGPIRNSGLRRLKLTTTSHVRPKYLIGKGLIFLNGDNTKDPQDTNEDCFVDQCMLETTGLDGIATGSYTATSKLKVSRTTFRKVAEHGIYLAGDSNVDCLIEGCRFDGVQAPRAETRLDAIALKNTERAIVRRNYFTGFRHSAVSVADFKNVDTLIEGNRFERLTYVLKGARAAGILINWLEGGIIRHNWFNHIASHTIFVAPTHHSVTSGITIEDNRIVRFGRPGIGVCVQKDQAPGDSVRPTNIVIIGNTIDAPGGHGIQVDGLRGANRVTNNTVRSSVPINDSGVRLLDLDGGTIVDGNVIHGMTPAWDPVGPAYSVKVDNYINGILSP
jgi:hypothetical protein